MPIPSWSETAADNDDADLASGINWRELMRPAQVKSSARSMMAEIKKGFTLTPSIPGSINCLRLPTGKIIQWGVVDHPSGSTANAVNFLFPTNGAAQVNLTASASGFNPTPVLISTGSFSFLFTVKNKNALGQVVYSSACKVHWVAMGQEP